MNRLVCAEKTRPLRELTVTCNVLLLKRDVQLQANSECEWWERERQIKGLELWDELQQVVLWLNSSSSITITPCQDRIQMKPWDMPPPPIPPSLILYFLTVCITCLYILHSSFLSALHSSSTTLVLLSFLNIPSYLPVLFTYDVFASMWLEICWIEFCWHKHKGSYWFFCFYSR